MSKPNKIVLLCNTSIALTALSTKKYNNFAKAGDSGNPYIMKKKDKNIYHVSFDCGDCGDGVDC